MSDFALSEGGQGYDVDFSVKTSGRGAGKRDLRWIRGRTATAQRVQMHLRTFLGECRYNRLAGVPYTQVLMQRGISSTAARQILEYQITRVRGVVAVASMDLVYDPLTRVMSGTALVQGTDGAVFAVPLTAQLP